MKCLTCGTSFDLNTSAIDTASIITYGKCVACIRGVKVPCGICEKLVAVKETHTCETCGKSVCADHIVGQQTAPDDYINRCTECLEKF